MDVLLYNSAVCRLCGEENESGTLLYSCDENGQNLSDIINTFLPLKVSDDGQLPRTLCPGCTIQLEATVEFLNLIINGQKVIRELHQREKEYKKSLLIKNTVDDPEIITEKILYQINTSDGVYQVEHPISLQMAGLDKPKKKRGRPPKKTKTPAELEQEAEMAKELAKKAASQEANKDGDTPGKRRRKTPTRFREAVQGKELERIFKEEGVIDAEESDPDSKVDTEADFKVPISKEPEVIGHLQTSGEPVVVIKGKGRGRPKGPMRPTREECSICGMEFSCVGRYMSHVAQHGPAQYQCTECGLLCDTKLAHTSHQQETGHSGRNVILCKEEKDVKVETPAPPSEPLAGADVTKIEIVTLSEQPRDEYYVTDNNTQESANVEDKPVADETAEEVIDEPLGKKGKPRLKCTLCEKTFSNRQSKSMHMKAVHAGARPYVCAECGATFPYPRSLSIHALSHRRTNHSKGFACDLCGKVLNHPSSVVYHKEAEHAGHQYSCLKCGKRFKHKQLLQRHQLVHSQARPHTCKTCSATFKTKANLLNHQLLHSGIKKFACDICKQRFAHKTSLTLHIRLHTGQKPFACTVCGKAFSQKGNLSEHARIHSGEKPYPCALCPRRFTTSSQHRLHARRHMPQPAAPGSVAVRPAVPAVRPYACDTCGKRFASRSSCVSHSRRSLGVAALRCSVCARTFCERWSLLKHQRRHTGERPFRCPHCPRAFADCSNLNKHKKQVHKQISLLVDTKQEYQPAIKQAVIPTLVAQPEMEVVDQATPEPEQETEERVIYVTYDVDEGDAPAFHILDPEQGATLTDGKVLSTCDLYSGSSLLVHSPHEAHELHETHDVHELHEIHEKPEQEVYYETDELTEDMMVEPHEHQHMAVTDEQGNPLHFTMQDGTRLAITSADGKSLQVITQDGQTIPVEINGYNDEEEEITLEEMNEDTVVHQLNLQKTVESTGSAPVAHYFTIV